jgi:hypothetical protein
MNLYIRIATAPPTEDDLRVAIVAEVSRYFDSKEFDRLSFRKPYDNGGH